MPPFKLQSAYNLFCGPDLKLKLLLAITQKYRSELEELQPCCDGQSLIARASLPGGFARNFVASNMLICNPFRRGFRIFMQRIQMKHQDFYATHSNEASEGETSAC